MTKCIPYVYGKADRKLLDIIEAERDKNMSSERSSFQILKGTYRQRWDILQALYSCYLDGLGYKPIGWRENAEENPKF